MTNAIQGRTEFPEFGFMRLPQVLQIIPVSRSSWYAGIKKKIYPAPVALGPHTSAWRVEDIKALCQELSSSTKSIH